MRSLLRGIGPAFFVAIVVGVAIVAADSLLTRLVERMISADVSDEVGGPASVRLEGFPVIARVLSSSPLPRAEVTVIDVPLDGTEAQLDRIRVVLTDVVASTRGVQDASSATFTADIGALNLQRLLGIPEEVDITGVRLGQGVAELTVGGISVVTASAEIVEGALTLRPTDGVAQGLSLTIDLDRLPEGVVVDAVRITPRAAVLTGHLDDVAALLQP